MCGINGIFSSQRIGNMAARVEQMNRAVGHRGPDADCLEVIDESVGLGHRRLSIIDLDKRSNQPMRSHSGNTIIVYNGEIFNHLEIKKELEQEYCFKTESDTEVILAGFELRGIEWVVRKMNGMFALALFDKKKHTLYLLRDRFGIKPLYYTIQGNKVIFSSEVKGILSSGLIEARLNKKALDEYLGNRYVREPFTFFENIFQVESSSYIEFTRDNRVKKSIYWNLPALNFNLDYRELEIIEATDRQIDAAIRKWQMADVKVGAYLSGGIDSSLTTALLAINRQNSVDTYTIGFAEDDYNEFKFAREVADRYRTNHREFILNEDDYFGRWNELIGYKDAPLAVPNEIPLAIMSSGLSRDITVVISGEGADELFGGYGKIYRSAFDFEHRNTDRYSFYDFFIKKYEYVARATRDEYLSVQENYRDYFDNINIAEFQNYRNEENIFRFFHKYHIAGLLNRVDMTTMQTSVEARPPFLDHELVEFVYKEVPYGMKLKWMSREAEKKAALMTADQYSEILDVPKYILKKVAEKYLPYDVINRKKMGFPVPLTKWFLQLELMAQDQLKGADWLRQGAATSLCDHIKKTESGRAGQLLWMFCNVELFIKKYFSRTWKW